MLTGSCQELFVPEGKEDLDVYVNGTLAECIQVKCHKDTLTYVSLYSSKKDTSLYKRALDSIRENSAVKVKVISINGKISDELTDKTKLKRKLKGDLALKLNEQDAKRLAKTIDTKIWNEQELISFIESDLKSRFVEVDPVFGIRVLTEWIYQAAEHGQKITIQDLEQEICAIRIYLSHIEAFHHQLGYAIVPLFLGFSSTEYDEQVLLDDYYEGVSARPEHIVAGLDIVRQNVINDVENAFKKSNIVIVHGLSGAGKSTFAYRYIYENASSIAYEIRNCNPKNVNDVLASLSAITKGLKIPAMFYFDVNPSNREWIEAISILAGKKDVRCLVTMRQEDWNIQYPRISSTFNYEEITLELHREEAKQIFYGLIGRGKVIHNSFDDVWDGLEPSGNLLEFIYLLTHGETLENRIKSQIFCESKQNKLLLSFIGVTNYLGGELNLRGLLKLSNMSKVEFSSLIDNLKHEFFKIEDNLIKDVHPIRTKFIVKALFGNESLLLKETAMEIFNKIDISNGHLFILKMMKECGLTVEELISDFSNNELSPNQAYSIAKALLWCGINDYEKEHEVLISDLSNLIGPLWEVFLPINFTDIDINDSLQVFAKKIPNFSDVATILSQFRNQQMIFCHLERWLICRSFRFHPTNHKEWYFLSKFLILISWAKINNIEIVGYPDSQSIMSENLSECSQILLGLKSINRSDLVANYERQFIIHLRQEFNVIQFKKERNSLQLFSFLDYNADYDIDTDGYKGFMTERINMRIIDLCRCAFPEMKEYRSEILKDYLMTLVEDIPTYKHIHQTNLPLEEMQEPRTVLCNLYKKRNGIVSREEYANYVLQKRRNFINANNKMTHFLDEWHKNPKMAIKGSSLLFEELAELADKIHLSKPISEISEFGYGDSNNIFIQSNGESRKVNLDDIYKSIDNYFSGLRNFYYQLPKAISNEEHLIITASKNLFDTFTLLPEFQSNFIKAFGSYFSYNELNEIGEKERNSIKTLWVVWVSLRDRTNYNNIRYLLQRYEQMQITLVDKFVFAINKEWKDSGLDSEKLRVFINSKDIKVDLLYSTEYDFIRGFSCIQMAIAKKLAEYNAYSSQQLIIQNTIDKVILKPLYLLKKTNEVSLDGQQFVFNIGHLFAMADEVIKNNASYSFLPEQVENNKTIKELVVFNRLIMTMNQFVWICDKLAAIREKLIQHDLLASQIFDNYRQVCEKRIMEVNVSEFDMLSKLFLNNSDTSKLLLKAIEILIELISSIKTNPIWFMNSDKIKKTVAQLNDKKMYYQMQVLSEII